MVPLTHRSPPRFQGALMLGRELRQECLVDLTMATRHANSVVGSSEGFEPVDSVMAPRDISL